MFLTFGREIVRFDDETVRFNSRDVEIFMFDIDFMEDRKLVPS